MISKIFIFSISISSCSWACDIPIALWQASKWVVSDNDAAAIGMCINDPTTIQAGRPLYHLLKDKDFNERIETLQQKLRDDVRARIEKGLRINNHRYYHCYRIDTNAQQCSQPSTEVLTLLEYCLYTHMNDAIPSLINNGAEISKSLHWAINSRNYKGATLLIKKYNASIDEFDEEGNTPLLRLCNQKMSDDTTESVSMVSLLRLLLQQGAIVNWTRLNGLYPIYAAASKLNYPMLPLLLGYKKALIQKKFKQDHYFDPLTETMRSHNKDQIAQKETIAYLLRAGADPYYYIPYRKPFLAHMNDLCNNPDTIELYKTIKKTFKKRCHYGYRFFAYHARKGIEQRVINKITNLTQENVLPRLPEEIIFQILNYASPWSTITQKIIKQKYSMKREIKNMYANDIPAHAIQARLLNISGAGVEKHKDILNTTVLGTTIKKWIKKRIEKEKAKRNIHKINDLSQITCTAL